MGDLGPAHLARSQSLAARARDYRGNHLIEIEFDQRIEQFRILPQSDALGLRAGAAGPALAAFIGPPDGDAFIVVD
jgi:hypothetical protein